MRLVAQIPHQSCRISILSWNGKFFLKFEMGQMEQTFKASESDTGDIESFKAKISPKFIDHVLSSFQQLDEEFSLILES